MTVLVHRLEIGGHLLGESGSIREARIGSLRKVRSQHRRIGFALVREDEILLERRREIGHRFLGVRLVEGGASGL